MEAVILQVSVLLLLGLSLCCGMIAARNKTRNSNSVHVSSFPQFRVLSAEPQIAISDDWLTAAECDHIISLANPRFAQSSVVNNKTYTSEINKSFRSSFTANLEKSQTSIIKNIERRVCELLDTKTYLIEAFQVVRYTDGQEFKAHHDFFHHAPRSQRIHTLLVYLNDLSPENGGGTHFSEIDLIVTPKKGRALYFRNASDDGVVDHKTLHAGQKVHKAVKYALNIWVRNC